MFSHSLNEMAEEQNFCEHDRITECYLPHFVRLSKTLFSNLIVDSLFLAPGPLPIPISFQKALHIFVYDTVNLFSVYKICSNFRNTNKNDKTFTKMMIICSGLEIFQMQKV